MKALRVVACALVAVLLGGCGSGGETARSSSTTSAASSTTAAPGWGAEGVALLQAGVTALSADDWYETIRYFASPVDLNGDWMTLSDLVEVGSGQPFDVSLTQVYLGADGAFTVELWAQPTSETVGVVREMVTDGVESYHMLSSLEPHRDGFDYARDEAAGRLAPLVSTYASGWASGDADALAGVYTADAVVSGWDRPQPWRTAVEDAAVTLTLPDDLAARAAIYSDAPEGGTLHEAVVLLDETQPSGCAIRVAHLWELDSEGVRIRSDTRLLDVTSADRCLPADDRPQGWWTGRPEPILPDQRRNGTYRLDDGTEVPLYNSTPNLERLLDWGLGQFRQAGLTLPEPWALIFPPTRACADAAGKVHETEAGLQVTVCFDDQDACADPDCSSFTLPARLFMLHELGHVWTLQQLDAAAQDGFTEAAGLQRWRGDDIPYTERGAEHAAETLAWGLLGETHDAYRNLPSPGCTEVARRFTLLTGAEPLSTCP